MKNLFSFLKQINSQFIIFCLAVIGVAIAIIITNKQPEIITNNSNLNQVNESTENQIVRSNLSQENNVTVSELKIKNQREQNISNNQEILPIDNQELEENKNLVTENETQSLTFNNSVNTDLQSFNNVENEPLYSSPKTEIKTNFGHLPYQECNQKDLVFVGKYYHKERFLHKEAAAAFTQMKMDAKNEGIDLIIISGFRTIEEQAKLFQKQIEKRGSKEAAARLSAPGGYSEHHTGYTLDIGDGNNPDQDLKFTFENTAAYQWLTLNAVNYGFELSFPKNNTQGVSFEPWHWRFIGSTTASQIFAMARDF